MALTQKTKDILIVALANKAAGNEVAAAVDSSLVANAAASVAAIGATTNLPTAALSTSDTYTDAAVNTAINDQRTAVEARLDVIEAKIDAVIAALKAAGLML